MKEEPHTHPPLQLPPAHIKVEKVFKEVRPTGYCYCGTRQQEIIYGLFELLSTSVN